MGTNCYYDPETTLETLALMKEGLAKAGLLDKPTYLMAQPLGFNCPDAANTKYGYGMFFWSERHDIFRYFIFLMPYSANFQ